jgi:hypothetical protein
MLLVVRLGVVIVLLPCLHAQEACGLLQEFQALISAHALGPALGGGGSRVPGLSPQVGHNSTQLQCIDTFVFTRQPDMHRMRSKRPGRDWTPSAFVVIGSNSATAFLDSFERSA